MIYSKLLKKQGLFSAKQRKKEIEEHLQKIKKLRKEKILTEATN